MLDPLTALGLASNIIQLVQFTSDLVSKSREYYDSADGALVEQLELEAITKNLQKLSKDLVVPDLTSGGSKVTKTEQQLSELCKGCRDVSKELLIIIQGLKSEGSHSRWSSFRQALKSVWNEDKIKALEERLDRYRRQIDTTLLISLRESIGGLSESQLEAKRVSHIVLRDKKEVKQWQKELVDEVHQSNWKPQNENAMLRFLAKLSSGAKEEENEKAMIRFSAKLSASAKEDGDMLIKHHILERLRFGEMEDRSERIPKAHSKTFDWIFRSSEASDGQLDQVESSSGHNVTTGNSPKDPKTQGQWSNFVHWLQSDSSLYWITGKPGSGKSTLMKYLQSDHRTLEYLEPWINGHPITVDGFFFWNSSAAMQMSKLGLLQTLLYGAIKDNLELSMSELIQAFQLLISDESTKFFFFIDGLDEFDGDGAEIVTFIYESISSRTNVKFCVASRPWLVFEDAFQRQPSLRVEDLTASDIRLFVTEKLHESDIFVTLNRLQPSAASSLIAEVTANASSVFLWVQLVVDSLLEGLRDGDAITDLQSRLLILPSDLEELFEKMLRDLKPAYFEQASMYFQIVRASTKTPTLLSLAFAEEGMEKAISYDIKPETDEALDFRAEGMRRRLSSRCKGLLEAPRTVFDTRDTMVQYLHRTVRDYICQPKVWEFVSSGTNESFDPNVALSACWLLRIKTMTPTLKTLGYFWAFLKSCTDYSIKFEESRPDVNVSLLDELSRVGDNLFETPGPNGTTRLQEYTEHQSSLALLNPSRARHWTCTEDLRPGFEHGTMSFLGYAFIYPLHTYVENKLRSGASLDERIAGQSLLYTASYRLNVRSVELLFSLRADPNILESEQMGWTTWEQFLWGVKNPDEESMENPGKVADIVQLFLEHGADTETTLDDLTVEDFINERFRNLDAARTDELLNKVVVARKTAKKSKNQDRKRVVSPFGTLPLLERTEATVVEESLRNPSARDARNLDRFRKSLNMSVVSKEPLKKAKNKSRGLWGVFRRSKYEV
ncbi:uncharacterized protein PAC_06205 [Phialocephala subalpina]|uniref:NACHT domain-containing protein n=1 Tax=Phialocephala subalpina TaxID=576137 RepID=A0A1L7WU56_9HELO|nr:uncharacterized protein PAC_06205 [Phialocephala subalpina]